MKIEEELKTDRFRDELHKAELNVLFTASWLKSRINQYLKNFGLYHEWFNVLRILRGQHPKPLCLRDIAERMLDRNSNVTRILDNLIAKGWVLKQQSEHDRREISVVLTPEGLQMLDEVNADLQQNMLHFSALSEAEARLLNALLDKMRDVE